MESHAKAFGHPIHPMLVMFPLGLLPTALIFDIICLSTGNPRWADVSFWMITAGIIGALLAAIFGAIDWAAIPRGTRAFRVATWHGVGNLVVAVLFVASWILRLNTPALPITAFVLAATGNALALVTGWLGGELVDRLGVGVADNADLNAPSSLHSGSSARPSTREMPGTHHLPPRPA